MKLSILIPSIESRRSMLSELVCSLIQQCGVIKSITSFVEKGCNILSISFENVEIISAIDSCVISTGEKRNLLLSLANNEWVSQIDEDDYVFPYYVSKILEALNTNPDVIGFNGYMTHDGENRENFIISKDLPYLTKRDDNGNKLYLRHINHLSPIRKNIALQIGFKDITFAEDYDYAVRLKDSGLIKSEVFIESDMYHYQYKKNK